MIDKRLKNLTERQNYLAEMLAERYPDAEQGFIVAVMVNVKHPDDTEHMIRFLREERSHDDIICEAIWVKNERYHPDRNIPLEELENNVR